MTFKELIESKDLDLDIIILEMTSEAEALTVEWVFKAIDKTRDNLKKIQEETNTRLDKIYGKENSRDKIYQKPHIKKQVIDELIGENIFNAAMYYIDRGVSRKSNSKKVTDDVAKDYKAKRESLKKKILKLANGEKIEKFNEIEVGQDGKFETSAVLESGDFIEIYTIVAGGWNIQKYHFRGLAKRKKGRK